MHTLIWTPHAIADLDRLHQFIKPKNPQAARRAIQTIRAGVRLLTEHPGAGRTAATLPSEFREWWIPFGSSGYLVLYRSDEAQVVILAVKHGKELGF